MPGGRGIGTEGVAVRRLVPAVPAARDDGPVAKEAKTFLNPDVAAQSFAPKCQDGQCRWLDPRVRAARPGPADDRRIVAVHGSMAVVFGEDGPSGGSSQSTARSALRFVSPSAFHASRAYGVAHPGSGNASETPSEPLAC